MVLRVVDATDIRPGTIFIVDGEPFKGLSNDISKTGKHGASKCRIEAIGVFTEKKKIVAVPGGERFDVPNVDKRKAQVLNVSERTASVMDLETYETLDLPFMIDIKDELASEKQVEYWDIEGKKVIMRVM